MLRFRWRMSMASCAAIFVMGGAVYFSHNTSPATATAIFGVASAALALLGFVLLRATAAACRSFAGECERIAEALRRGELSVRTDGTKVVPDLRPALASLDAGVAALVAPLRGLQAQLDRLSHGDLSEQRTVACEGELAVLSGTVDRVTKAIEDCVAEISVLASKAFAGKLSERADATRHEGDFRIVMEGLNATLDATLMPVMEAVEALESLAQRNLGVRAEGDYVGDHARLNHAVNTTAQQLQASFQQVAASVKQVNVAAGEIASSSQAVASGASEQAASLEETSASLVSMTEMTKQATDNAQAANALAQKAKTAATDGSAAMEQMTGAMAKIKASAEGTSQIIKDINEVAFQTNLLALNAAVEAARAGEAGRGFAVVAEEVRSLALRSKEAATKTEDLIRQSVAQAGEGAITARNVNEKLAEIATSVTKVSDIVAEIAVTAREQASGIDQVTKAIEQMNQVTQQNAASSEQSSSAATELSGQSEELDALVRSFRLEDTTRGGSQAALPRQVRAGIAAHGMWKTHLVAAIATGKATVKVEDAGHDDRCKFGRWLHGTPALRTASGYDHIRGLHARFHVLAAEILRLGLAGNKDEARRQMNPSSEYSKVTAELTKMLQSWASEEGLHAARRHQFATAGVSVQHAANQPVGTTARVTLRA